MRPAGAKVPTNHGPSELWPSTMVLLPVTEDDLIAFGRELEATDEVVGRLLAGC
jgi:hypothetical protein